MQKRAQKTYTSEELLKQKDFSDINFMNALMLLAESKQDREFWEQIETNFLACFELKSEKDMEFRMQQGLIANFVVVF